MTSERNRAVRIAYAHARHGRESLVDAWLEIAAGFAPLAPKTRTHADRLLAASSGPIPGQIDLDGNVY